MNIRKTAKAVIPLIIFIIIASFLLKRFLPTESGDSVKVSVGSDVVAEYPLAEDGLYTLNGGTNVLRIENGKAKMESARCPDGICIKQGWVYRNGECITCLPNKLIVEVVKADDSADLVI